MAARSHDIADLIDFSEHADGSLEVVPKGCQAPAVAARKKRFWNEGGIPGLGLNDPPSPQPAPLPGHVSPGPSVGTDPPGIDRPVIVLRAVSLTGKAGVPLVQYELRCPNCGAEQPWNLYSQSDLPSSLECPACEDAYETAPMRASELFAQLPLAPTEKQWRRRPA